MLSSKQDPTQLHCIKMTGRQKSQNLKMHKALCSHFPTANIYLAIPMLVYELIHISSFFRD